MNDEYISTEHILLALIGVNSPAQKILLDFKVEYQTVKDILKELRGSQTINDPFPENKFRVLEKYTTNMPSAHAAVAFAAATLVAILVPSSFPALFLAYLLALMVAQGRVASGIHTVSEAVLGALLGAVVTLLLYRLYCRVG